MLNKLAQANPKELKQGIKQQFGKNSKRNGCGQGQTTIRQVSDVIAKYGYNGQEQLILRYKLFLEKTEQKNY